METTTITLFDYVFVSLVLIIAFVLYMIPWFVSKCRGHNNSLAIFMVNLFLGWNLFGWFGALIWACTDNVKAK